MANESTSAKRQTRTGTSGRTANSRRPKSAVEVIKIGREQFEAVTGSTVETVSAFNKKEDGWELHVEVLELARIPDTTSLLATYRVRLEAEGDITGYERVRRYARGQADGRD